MYLQLMYLQLMYLQLMYLQLMCLQLMYLQLMYLQSHIYKNIPVSFDFMTTWIQGVFLCSPCIYWPKLGPSFQLCAEYRNKLCCCNIVRTCNTLLFSTLPGCKNKNPCHIIWNMKQTIPNYGRIKVPNTSPASKYTKHKIYSARIKDEIKCLYTKKNNNN